MTRQQAPEIARELHTLVDVLLPGDGHFPPASAVGAHGLLAERLRERLGTNAIDDIAAGSAASTSGIALAALNDDARVAAVRRFERDTPDLFATLRTFLYFSYYQSPLVVAAIRDLGIAYNDAPQPLGYAMAPFDPTPGKDAPVTPRGHYLATEAVARLPHLPPAARATRSEQ